MTTSGEHVHNSKPFDPWEEYDVHGAATIPDPVPDAQGLLPKDRRGDAEFPDYSGFNNPG